MSNRLAMSMTVLGLAGAMTAVVLVLPRSDELRIEKPKWMTEPPPSIAETPKVEVANSERMAANPKETAESTSAAKDIADNSGLASALTESKQAIVFHARTLIDAGIAEEVAAGMVSVMDNIVPAYDFLVARDDQTVHRYAHEFLIAIWPDLGDLIRRGDIKLDIVAFPESNWSKPKVPLVADFDTSERVLTYHMNLERWSVSFAFNEESCHIQDIYARVVSASHLK